MSDDATRAVSLKRKATVAVSYVDKKEDMEEGPFVCKLGATGGLPPPGTEFRAWRKNLPYRGHMMVLRGRTDGVDYIGANHAPLGYYPAADACKYLLGTLVPVTHPKGGGGGGVDDEDSPTYELKLVPVGGSKIVDLECRCHAVDYAEPEWDGAEDLNDYTVRAAHNARLLSAFASAKQQRKTAKIMAQRRVDGNTIAAPDAMEATLKAATEGEMDASALSKLAGERRNIPTHNPSATNALDAYPFNQFPMFALLEKRTRWKELVKASKKPSAMKELRDGGVVDEFVLGLVPKLAEHSGGATDREENDRQKGKAKALAAMDFLLVFLGGKDFISEKREKRNDGGDGDGDKDGGDQRTKVHREQDPVVDHARARGPDDPARLRRIVHGVATSGWPGGADGPGPGRAPTVLQAQAHEGPGVPARHTHGAARVFVGRRPGRARGSDEDEREGADAARQGVGVRGEEDAGEAERRGRRDSGDAAARRYQDAHGYTPRDQTEDHGGGEEEVGRMTSGESNVESNHHCTFNKIGHFP